MALALGKLTILVGAGIVGSVLAKEGRMSNVTDFFSGALKIAMKQSRQDISTSPNAKPQTDSLLAQVNSLREELQILARDPSLIIVNSSGKGAGKYGLVIVIAVVGYGYIWWKGWRLPDMMFATKRSLSDACNVVAKQLEDVYLSLRTARRELTSRIDLVDGHLDEFAVLNADTKEQVSNLGTEISTVSINVQSVQYELKNLEFKINSIEERQALTNKGVMKLCDYAWNLENSRSVNQIQESPSSASRPALEAPKITTSPRESPSSGLRPALEAPKITTSRAVSLPLPELSQDQTSPSGDPGSDNGPCQVRRPAKSLESASGLKELGEMPSSGGTSNVISNEHNTLSSGVFGRIFPSMAGSFLSRTQSVKSPFK